MIVRAITKFMAVYEPETTEEFEEFVRWFRKNGYLQK
jgi:hypothetical protein